MKFSKLVALLLALVLAAPASVRIDTPAEYAGRTANLINYNAAYTTTFWIYLSVDMNWYSHFWAITAMNTEVTSNYENSDFAGTDADGTTFRAGAYVSASGGVGTGLSLSTGTWYYVAVRRNSSSSLEIIVNGSVQVTDNTNVSGRAAVGGEWIGRLNGGNELNGRVAYLKQWAAALSDVEIADEGLYENAKRTANLHKVTRLESDLVDEINGYDWTATGTLTFEADPPGLTEYSGGGGSAPSFRGTLLGVGH